MFEKASEVKGIKIVARYNGSLTYNQKGELTRNENGWPEFSGASNSGSVSVVGYREDPPDHIGTGLDGETILDCVDLSVARTFARSFGLEEEFRGMEIVYRSRK